MELRDCQGHQREVLLRAIEKLNRVLCRKCHRIRAKADKDSVCTYCWKPQIMSNAFEGTEEATLEEQNEIQIK